MLIISLIVLESKDTRDNTLTISLNPEDPDIIDLSDPKTGSQSNPTLFVYKDASLIDPRDYTLTGILLNVLKAVNGMILAFQGLSDLIEEENDENNADSNSEIQDDFRSQSIQTDKDEAFASLPTPQISPLKRKATNSKKSITLVPNASIETVRNAIPYSLNLMGLRLASNYQGYTEPSFDFAVFAISKNIVGEICIAIFDGIPADLNHNPFKHLKGSFRQFEWFIATNQKTDTLSLNSAKSQLLQLFAASCPIERVTNIDGKTLYDRRPIEAEKLYKERSEYRRFFFKPNSETFLDTDKTGTDRYNPVLI